MRLFTELMDKELEKNRRRVDWMHKNKGLIDYIQEIRDNWINGKQVRKGTGRDAHVFTDPSRILLLYPVESDRVGYDPMITLEETVDLWDDIEESGNMYIDNSGDLRVTLRYIPTGAIFDVFFMFSRNCKLIRKGFKMAETP